MSKTFCQVSKKRIDPLETIDFVRCSANGGQAFFFGTIRTKNRGMEVVAVEYDCALELANQTLLQIADETRNKWGDGLRISIVHRIGKLAVADISIGIGVSSPHRDESFQACRYIIEQIKLRAPIWKKEHYENSETAWIQGHALCQHGPANPAKVGCD